MHPTDFGLIPKEGNEKPYTAGGNASWVSPYWTPQQIPIISSALDILVHGKFRSPLPLELVVIVNDKSNPHLEQHRLGSQLRRVSPEEEHLAFILATYRDIQQGQHVEDLCWDCFMREPLTSQ